ncbi:MAG: 1-acyl-sn-glycerol-3-phosphate acyltransferase [candidate division Zixibacteria bacterium]|nr:1-acyl-sn-glycerol-3-phosphate acyltransferase [candidate division Zixibacteria bacterium]
MTHALLLRPFIKFFSGVRVVGGEHIRGLDQYIIIANHNSHLDTLVLFFLLPLRDIARSHPVADEPYFSKSRLAFRLISFLFQPIWITRGRPETDRDPLEKVKQVLASRHNLIIFPEGTRGRPGEMESFKSGIGRLVAQCPDVPIVPVYLSGPERALPKGSKLLLPFWNSIVIGHPQTYHGPHRDITRRLESILVELSLSNAARRKRSARKRAAAVVAFLGIDGSGKSTVSRIVAQGLSRASNVAFVSDGLEFYEQGASRDAQPLLAEKLREIIGRNAKRAKSLRAYKVPKLAELLLRDYLIHEVERWYNPEIIITDGLPIFNMAAWAALYKKEAIDEETCTQAISYLTEDAGRMDHSERLLRDLPELKFIRHLSLTRLRLPKAVVMLDVAPGTACARISSRGEQRQVHETEEKLSELREAYLMVCEVVQRHWGIPVQIIDGSQTLQQVASKSLQFAESLSLQKGEAGESSN